MTDSKNITAVFIFGAVMLFAVWLGISIVTDQIETLFYVAVGTTLLVCALLGRKIWLIIPLAGSINLTLMIPGQPTTLMIAQALFIGFCGLQFLMRRLPFRIKVTELEIWIIIVTLSVIQAYARAPVSLNILGGESVGGRPYALFLITLVSGCILAGLRVDPSDLKWVFRLSIIGGLLNLALNAIGYFIPRFGVWIGSADLRAMTNHIEEGVYGEDLATRVGFLGQAGRNLSLFISSLKAPIRACFHPLWAPFILLSIAFSALSGFRSELGIVALTYMVGIAYRGGANQFFIACLTFVMSLAFVAILNTAIPLPSNIQRAFSFLPGTWDEVHRQDAQGSTQWRFDMWEAALLTENWIRNKTLGDGLGMTREEYSFILSMKDKDIGGQVGSGQLSPQQEMMMAANNYHSGPVSTVRAVGYIGLLILLLAQIRLAVHAHRQIRRAKGTIWFPLTLLIGIPLIWNPIFFVFVFGDYGPALTTFLIGAAMVRLLENNLPLSTNKKTLNSVI